MKKEPKDKRKTIRYRKRLEQLKLGTIEEGWKDHWLELAEYMLPRRGKYLNSDEANTHVGTKKHNKILNGSICDAVRTLSAGMQGGLTSPSRPWFKLTLNDKSLAEVGAVRNWLHDVREIMLTYLQRSNFYSAIHKVYGELGVFGTGVMLILEEGTGLRFRPLTIGEYYLALDKSQMVNTVYRRLTMTVRQMEEQFGLEKMSERTQTMYNKNQGENKIEVIHVVQPNTKHDPASLGIEGKKYESVYFEESAGDKEEVEQFLSVGGFDSMPFVAPRWDVAATETYGTSPGMSALGDVKMLQMMEKKSLKALDKMIDPPMNAPSSMKNTKINALPGGVNFIDPMGGQAGISPTYQIRPDFQNMEFKIDRVESRIRRFFFNDMFATIIGQDKQMTAREVSERHEEKLMMLGSVLERLQSEMLSPIIQRVYEVLQGLGAIPPAPDELGDGDVEIQYISLLAQAQQMVAAPAIEQAAAFVGNLAGVSPDVIDKLDFDQIVDEYTNMLGVPTRVVRTDAEVEEIRQAKAQQQQQMQMQEQMQQGIQGAKVLSETDTGDGSALNALMGSVV